MGGPYAACPIRRSGRRTDSQAWQSSRARIGRYGTVRNVSPAPYERGRDWARVLSRSAREAVGVPDRLVGEVGDAALEGLGAGEAHGFVVAGLAGQALAGPGGDREDLQPQLVDQVVLDQRAYELKAAGDDDVPVYVLLQRRDLVRHVALEDCRVVPGGMFEGRGHHVLGQAVQPVRQLAAAGWPPRGEPLVAPPAQQEGPGAQRLAERELGELRATSDQADPAAGPEAFVTGRVLDDSVERDVLAHDDLSHFGSAPRWSSGNQTLAARPASPPCLEEQPVSFAGPPGVILDGFHEVFADGHGLLLLLIGVVSYRRRRRRGW